MKKQEVDFHEVYDLFAIRVILNSKPEKRARMTFRIRSVGPMTLANYTEQELTQLRQAVTRKNSKDKYL